MICFSSKIIPVASSKSLNFLMLGDWGKEQNNQEAVAKSMYKYSSNFQPQFIVSFLFDFSWIFHDFFFLQFFFQFIVCFFHVNLFELCLAFLYRDLSGWYDITNMMTVFVWYEEYSLNTYLFIYQSTYMYLYIYLSICLSGYLSIDQLVKWWLLELLIRRYLYVCICI